MDVFVLFSRLLSVSLTRVCVCTSWVNVYNVYFLPDETVLCWLSPLVPKARCNHVFSAKNPSLIYNFQSESLF